MNHPIRYHTAKIRRHSAPAETIVKKVYHQLPSTQSILQELETEHPFVTPLHHWLACQATRMEYRRR